MFQPTHFVNLWVFLINAVSFCCMIAGSVSSKWYIFVDERNQRNPIELTFGLWKHCRITLSDQGDGCYVYDDSDDGGQHDWVKSVQVLMVVACVLVGINLLVIIAAFRKHKLVKWSIATSIIAGRLLGFVILIQKQIFCFILNFFSFYLNWVFRQCSVINLVWFYLFYFKFMCNESDEFDWPAINSNLKFNIPHACNLIQLHDWHSNTEESVHYYIGKWHNDLTLLL